MRNTIKWPLIIPLLCALTLAGSLYVSWQVNGKLLSTVRIVDLANYGGVSSSDVKEFKLWRFVTAQFVHVRWPHMLFNVMCLFGIGCLVERQIGWIRTFLVWLVAGGFATLISPVFIKEPYNVGTGASHAVLAFVGCALVMVGFKKLQGAWLKLILAVCLFPAFTLDFVYAGYPKIGHITALFLGAVLGLVFCKNDASL